MAETGSKIFDLDALTDIANDDVLVEVDVSDTTDSTDGTNKKITVRDLLNKLNEGWIPAEQTWEYLSGTTITVPTGAGSVYRKGMPFKLTANSIELQGYIVGIADTVLTILGDTLTNHTFTENYYAKSGTVPQDFDGSFDWTPNYSAGGSMTYTTVTTDIATFSIKGDLLYFIIQSTGTTGGSAAPNLAATLPITSGVAEAVSGGASVTDGSTMGGFFRIDASDNSLAVFKYNASAWGLGSSRRIRAEGFYPI